MSAIFISSQPDAFSMPTPSSNRFDCFIIYCAVLLINMLPKSLEFVNKSQQQLLAKIMTIEKQFTFIVRTCKSRKQATVWPPLL